MFVKSAVKKDVQVEDPINATSSHCSRSEG